MDKLDLAIIYATKKHSGATRKMKTTPYILHPLEACVIASSLTDDVDVLTATVLHDVIEDTSTSVDDIKKDFGDKVCSLLLSDTEDKMRNLPPEKSWKLRKQATLDSLLKATKEEQIICLSDKLSNLRDMYRDYIKVGDELFNRFNVKNKREHEWYYRGIGERLVLVKDTTAYKEFIDLLDLVFAK